MKKTILGLLLGLSLCAHGESFTCTTYGTDFSYKFTDCGQNNYLLEIISEETLPGSCESRWGCETRQVVTYSEIMKLTLDDEQPQSVLEIYKGNRSMAEIIDGEGFLEVLVNSGNGGLITKTIDLNCRF